MVGRVEVVEKRWCCHLHSDVLNEVLRHLSSNDLNRLQRRIEVLSPLLFLFFNIRLLFLSPAVSLILSVRFGSMSMACRCGLLRFVGRRKRVAPWRWWYRELHNHPISEKIRAMGKPITLLRLRAPIACVAKNYEVTRPIETDVLKAESL